MVTYLLEPPTRFFMVKQLFIFANIVRLSDIVNYILGKTLEVFVANLG